MRNRTERFVKNLAASLVHCAFEEGEAIGVAILGLVVVVAFCLLGTAVYEVIFNPHAVSASSLDLLSISPDKWISG
jgi:hypothetical protein